MNDVIYREDAIGAILSVGHIAELSDGDAVIRVSAVNYVLRNLPSAQPERWIPVTEGLPEEKKQVLVCDDFGEIYIAEYETFSDGKWRWCESVEYRSLYGIVAWMPLPDPWKGEEDDT